jgi:hypothetical protein
MSNAPPEALYIEWRRWLEEDKLFFGRRRGAPFHQCWAEQGQCIVQPRPGVPFYGCAECGRTHYCCAPYRACPRFTPLHSPDAVCPFSGHVLEPADSAQVVGNFEGERVLRTAESDVYHMEHGREFDPFVYTLSADLERRASGVAGNSALRNQLFRQADEARSHIGVRRDIRELERMHARAEAPGAAAEDAGFAAPSAAGWNSPHEPASDDAAALPRHEPARISAIALDYGDENNGHGHGGAANYDEGVGGGNQDGDVEGGEADGWFAANGSAVRLTPEGAREVAYDAAFLERYLEPALRFVEYSAADFAPQRLPQARAFGDVPAALYAKKRALPAGLANAAPAPKRKPSARLAVPGENYLLVSYQSPPLPWRMLRMHHFGSVRSEAATLLDHQCQIYFAVCGFVRDVNARAAAAPESRPLPPPLSSRQYTLRVDRAIMIFNWERAADKRVDIKEPTQVVRATVMLLSTVFSADFCRADACGTVLPVWLADPYLEAAERAGLLATPFPFASAETASPISRSRTHDLLETLRRRNFSPQHLAALFRDPTE